MKWIEINKEQPKDTQEVWVLYYSDENQQIERLYFDKYNSYFVDKLYMQECHCERVATIVAPLDSVIYSMPVKDK